MRAGDAGIVTLTGAAWTHTLEAEGPRKAEFAHMFVYTTVTQSNAAEAVVFLPTFDVFHGEEVSWQVESVPDTSEMFQPFLQ